ncbi:hypothetical protein RLW55_02510 [Hyphomicrobium sp. B1]|uniref:hypothetical protein n=1 Tax=Hyphomicrobium sp. B1 TaxID=3075651 RepID=UPI003C2B2B97
MKLIVFLAALAAVTVSAATAHAETVDPAQAIAQKFSDTDAEPQQRSFARPGADYEADMLARAQAEELARKQQETEQMAAKPAISESAPQFVPSSTVSAPPVAKLAALPPKPAADLLPTRSEPAPMPTPPTRSAATVLLVLDPDNTGLGFKPDPILCIDNTCWLSNGFRAPARSLPRNQAMALSGTNDMTAESCSGKSGCVFRNVIIDPMHRIDVIEVGEGGGASSGAYTITADKTCRVDGTSLACSNGLATQNFRIWVVPEAQAEAAGAVRLENTLAEGLPEIDVTSANDK